MFASDKKRVIKDNILIQKTSCKLDLLDYKCLLFICSRLRKNKHGEPVLDYKFDFREVFKVLDMNTSGRSYLYLNKALEHLRDRTVVFLPSEDEHESVCWLKRAIAKKNSANIKVTLSEKIVKYLFDLQAFFTVYDVDSLMNMNSVHSIRLYEILKSYQNLGNKTFDIGELKFLMAVQEQKSYDKFDRLNERILKTAVDEINEKTDLKITYTPIKTGKKYTHIAFAINPK